jgi:hypothetical protein
MPFQRILRPVIVLTVLALLLQAGGFGQTPVRTHDASFQFGVLSIDQLLDIFGDVLLVVITLGNYAKDNPMYSGVPFLTYHYSANSRFGFGGAIGGYSSWGDLVDRSSDLLVGDFKETNYIAAAELDYHWIMRRGFQVYSGAGFGVRIRKGRYTDESGTESFSKALPTFHINAIGVRFGQKIGFFAEFGYGYKGMLSAGINAQF